MRVLLLFFFVVVAAACGGTTEEALFNGAGAGSGDGGGGGGGTTTASCGNASCTSGQYCRQTIKNGAVTSLACSPLPDHCLTTPTCSCVDAVLSCNDTFTCVESAGHVKYTCATK